ncbi:hypothetical protein C8J56DRAFT_905541 [Mycena floridula]|nr:hypothetical protein C8J56DRAFT_905541 [Mycena floridula]
MFNTTKNLGENPVRNRKGYEASTADSKSELTLSSSLEELLISRFSKPESYFLGVRPGPPDLNDEYYGFQSDSKEISTSSESCSMNGSLYTDSESDYEGITDNAGQISQRSSEGPVMSHPRTHTLDPDVNDWLVALSYTGTDRASSPIPFDKLDVKSDFDRTPTESGTRGEAMASNLMSNDSSLFDPRTVSLKGASSSGTQHANPAVGCQGGDGDRTIKQMKEKEKQRKGGGKKDEDKNRKGKKGLDEKPAGGNGPGDPDGEPDDPRGSTGSNDNLLHHIFGELEDARLSTVATSNLCTPKLLEDFRAVTKILADTSRYFTTELRGLIIWQADLKKPGQVVALAFTRLLCRTKHDITSVKVMKFEHLVAGEIRQTTAFRVIRNPENLFVADWNTKRLDFVPEGELGWWDANDRWLPVKTQIPFADSKIATTIASKKYKNKGLYTDTLKAKIFRPGSKELDDYSSQPHLWACCSFEDHVGFLAKMVHQAVVAQPSEAQARFLDVAFYCFYASQQKMEAHMESGSFITVWHLTLHKRRFGDLTQFQSLPSTPEDRRYLAAVKEHHETLKAQPKDHLDALQNHPLIKSLFWVKGDFVSPDEIRSLIFETKQSYLDFDYMSNEVDGNYQGLFTSATSVWTASDWYAQREVIAHLLKTATVGIKLAKLLVTLKGVDRQLLTTNFIVTRGAMKCLSFLAHTRLIVDVIKSQSRVLSTCAQLVSTLSQEKDKQKKQMKRFLDKESQQINAANHLKIDTYTHGAVAFEAFQAWREQTPILVEALNECFRDDVRHMSSKRFQSPTADKSPEMQLPENLSVFQHAPSYCFDDVMLIKAVLNPLKSDKLMEVVIGVGLPEWDVVRLSSIATIVEGYHLLGDLPEDRKDMVWRNLQEIGVADFKGTDKSSPARLAQVKADFTSRPMCGGTSHTELYNRVFTPIPPVRPASAPSASVMSGQTTPVQTPRPNIRGSTASSRLSSALLLASDGVTTQLDYEATSAANSSQFFNKSLRNHPNTSLPASPSTPGRTTHSKPTEQASPEPKVASKASEELQEDPPGGSKACCLFCALFFNTDGALAAGVHYRPFCMSPPVTMPAHIVEEVLERLVDILKDLMLMLSFKEIGDGDESLVFEAMSPLLPKSALPL